MNAISMQPSQPATQVYCAHDWTTADTDPATAGSGGYAVACKSCGATGWQPAAWRNGPCGVYGFWTVGDVQIGEV